jgi:hypothetical protein
VVNEPFVSQAPDSVPTFLGYCLRGLHLWMYFTQSDSKRTTEILWRNCHINAHIALQQNLGDRTVQGLQAMASPPSDLSISALFPREMSYQK